MNIVIITDLEGISGVDTMEMVSEKGTPGHRFALERLIWTQMQQLRVSSKAELIKFM